MISRPYKLAYQVGPSTSGPAQTFAQKYADSGMQDLIKKEVEEKGFLGYLYDSFARAVGLKPTLSNEDIKEITKQIVEATSGNVSGGSSAGLSPDDRAKYGLIPYLLLPTYQMAQKQKTTTATPPKALNNKPGSTVKTSNVYQCPYSGCTGFNKGSSCFNCRCQKLCSGKGGVKTVKSDGSCYCKGVSSGTSSVPKNVPKPIDKLTSGCSYSGCNSFTGMTRCRCRCSKICASKGGVKTVTSGGSCYCKGVPKPTTTGCSTYLKQRCGNFCAQRPGNPYLDSKCSCFCR